MDRTRRSVLRVAGWLTAFMVAGILGRTATMDGTAMALVWPAAGMAVLWLTSGDPPQWRIDLPVMGVAAFVVNVATGAPPALGLVFVLCNMGQAVLFVVLCRRWLPRLRGFGGRESLRRVEDLLLFFGASVVACGAAAVVGVVGLEATLGTGSLVDFVVWGGRNTTGLLVVGVIGFLLRGAVGDDRPPRLIALRRMGAAMVSTSGIRVAEIAVLATTSTLLYAFVFGYQQGHPFAFLLLVPTFWAALRFTPLTSALHSLAAGSVAIAATLHDMGPFLILDDLSFRALVAQVFFLMVVLAGLALAFTHTAERSVSARLSNLLDESTRREADVVAARDQAERLFLDAPFGAALMDTEGTLQHLNPALCDLLGRPEDDLVGSSLARFGYDSADTTVNDHLQRVMEGDLSRTEATWTCRTLNGGARVVSLSSTLLQNADGWGGQAILTNVVDVSARERYQRQLSHFADHDSLTGLANRRKFHEELQRHLDQNHTLGGRGAVLMLDLDHFKDVNDTLGHVVGDQLLVSLSQALRRRMRDTDVVARLGGDEFAMLLPSADLVSAERVASEVVDLVRTCVEKFEGAQRRVTVSVGGVVIEADDTTASLLSTADTMLYDAKEAGRNCFAVLDRQVHAQPQGSARMMWTERIEAAISRDDFELYLQPILDVVSGRVTGAEALLRMRHDGEIVMPGQFLPVAERTDSIVQIDRWVVRRSVSLLARLQRTDPAFKLSLNLSAKSVQNLGVEQELRRAFAMYDADPTGLVLEITETAALKHIQEARAFIERIRPLGCRFALDDFGAGFGSFYYFKHLHFDVVKIDGEFVDGCVRSPMDRAIISSVAKMAAELGKETVAEFVTDAATLDVVKSLGVDFAQGYHVGRPVPIEDFIDEMLARDAVVAAVVEGVG